MHKKISSPFSQNYNYLLKTTNKKIIGHSKKEKSKNSNINQIPMIESNSILPPKKFEEVLSKYKEFVDKKFGNYLKRQEKIKKDNDDIFNKTPEIKKKINLNVYISAKDTNEEFNKFLDSTYCEFLEENDVYDLPENNEFYSKENKLGHNKNNKNDYSRRRTLIFKEDLLIIEKNLELDCPLQIANLENNNKNDINIQPALNIDQNANQILPILLDLNQTKNMINAIKIIIDIYRSKAKDKIYFGFDVNRKNNNNSNEINVRNIYKIYGKNFVYENKQKKIKTLEYNNYSVKFKVFLTKTKSIKELFNIESMTKEEILQKIEDIINKFKENNN